MAEEEHIIASHLAGEIPELFVEHVRLCRDDDTRELFRKKVIELHNSGIIDVLEAARRIGHSPINQLDFFLPRPFSSTLYLN